MRRWVAWWTGTVVVLLVVWGALAVTTDDEQISPEGKATVTVVAHPSPARAQVQVRGVPGSGEVRARPSREPDPSPEPATSTGPGLRLTMTVEDWLLIDATMDNTRWSADVDGQDDVSAAATAVRQAGWDQVATHEPENLGWPPHDATAAIVLSPEQWQFVVESIEKWSALEPPDGEQALIDQRVVATIRAALADRRP